MAAFLFFKKVTLLLLGRLRWCANYSNKTFHFKLIPLNFQLLQGHKPLQLEMTYSFSHKPGGFIISVIYCLTCKTTL